jgi:DNA-binding LytR/AlgR family response regulator
MNIHQQRNLAEITPFFTQKTSISHFLILTVFFAVLIVVFGEPTGLLAFTTQSSYIIPQLQIAFTTVAGLLTLIASRIFLAILASRHDVTPTGILIWILVELIVIIAVLCFVLWQVSGGGRLTLAPLAGDLLLGLIAIEAMPYVISFLIYRLREEEREVQRLQELLDQNQSQEILVAGPLGERTINFYDRGKRLVFSTAGKNVLYIEAADNYVNIHYLNEGHEDTFILHNTLKEMERQLADTSLLRCHRGYMVNIDNVKLLRKEGISLILELSGSSKNIPVTKTYASTVTERLAPSKE